jgi:hypothetical protein
MGFDRRAMDQSHCATDQITRNRPLKSCNFAESTLSSSKASRHRDLLHSIDELPGHP